MEDAALLPQIAFVRKSERTLKDLTCRNIPIALIFPRDREFECNGLVNDSNLAFART